MKNRLNCWEYMKCGREIGGINVEKDGVCPTQLDSSKNGVNHGKSGGRFCWRICGTFCDGKKQGTFAKKLSNCVNCPFLKMVQDEESIDFKL